MSVEVYVTGYSFPEDAERHPKAVRGLRMARVRLGGAITPDEYRSAAAAVKELDNPEVQEIQIGVAPTEEVAWAVCKLLGDHGLRARVVSDGEEVTDEPAPQVEPAEPEQEPTTDLIEALRALPEDATDEDVAAMIRQWNIDADELSGDVLLPSYTSTLYALTLMAACDGSAGVSAVTANTFRKIAARNQPEDEDTWREVIAVIFDAFPPNQQSLLDLAHEFGYTPGGGDVD